jgi:hypothetical protein
VDKPLTRSISSDWWYKEAEFGYYYRHSQTKFVKQSKKKWIGSHPPATEIRMDALKIR